MNRKALVAVLGTAVAAVTFSARAQNADTGAYVGASVGQSKYYIQCSGFSCDPQDLAFRLFGGYRFTRNLSAEVGYADLGKAKLSGAAGTDELHATAIDVSGIFQWLVANTSFSILARLGVYSGRMQLSGVDNGSKQSSNYTAGLGAEYGFARNFGVRAEWQRYGAMKLRNNTTASESDGDVDAFTLGVLYRFR